ncbi:hypothetical protein IMX07_05835 [bacterium]|nr:hypothetical protein [bacterium]
MLASATLATVFILSAISRGFAQAPPDPQMLLNLDLFAASGGDSGASEQSAGRPESLVEQIRTLRALGFLGGRRNYGAASDASQPSPNPYASPAPSYGDQAEPVE